MKADVKDFFMTGSHEYLAGRVSSVFSGSERRLISDILWFLLAHQYIRSDILDLMNSRVWQVHVGSGMGMNFSSEVADTAVYLDFERRFFLLQSVRTNLGIKAYFRFRDDLFMVIASTDGWAGKFGKEWHQYIDAVNSPYKLDPWELSSVSLSWLDVNVAFRPDLQRMVFSPFIKPTSLAIPLSEDSEHHPSVHTSWPKAVLNRFSGNSSFHCDFLAARALLVDRLHRHGASRSLTEATSRYDPWGRTVARRATRYGQIWWPLAYHRVWNDAGFNRALEALSEHPYMNALWNHSFGLGSSVPSMNVAWKIGGRHLFSILRSYANE